MYIRGVQIAKLKSCQVLSFWGEAFGVIWFDCSTMKQQGLLNMPLATMQNRMFRRGETVDFAHVLLCWSFVVSHRMQLSALHIPGL